MKTFTFLTLAAVAAAFVIPDQQTLESLSLEEQPHEPCHDAIWGKISNPETFWQELEERFDEASQQIRESVSDAIDYTHDTAVHFSEKFETAFAGEAWLDSADDTDLFDRPPHHRRPPHHGPPRRGRPGRRPHHPPHHGKPNETVYELIAKSKYTTKLAEAINEFPDLVDLLNGTKANYTVFAPTDRAFAKIPKKAPKPPKEFLKKLLTYHVSPEFYPAGRVLVSRTIPTALEAEFISTKDKKFAQRLSTQVGFRGLTVNFYSRIVAVDIFGTNGVIHGIDSILLPPPKGIDIITAFPGEFSTLELAILKTGLYDAFNDTSTHNGGTLFAPSNFAFKRLGPRINAFLFSKYGLKYLKALLLYHAADNITLYSDDIYKAASAQGGHHHGPPKGVFHVDLPTGLEGKSLSIDIARWGRLITIKINAFTRVAVSDGIAADGVIHVIPNVLIPPKTPGGSGVAEDDMDVEDFKERLAPFVEETEGDEWEMEL